MKNPWRYFYDRLADTPSDPIEVQKMKAGDNLVALIFILAMMAIMLGGRYVFFKVQNPQGCWSWENAKVETCQQ